MGQSGVCVENCQILLEMKTLKIIWPFATRWLTHEFCFRRFCEVYKAVPIALSQLYQNHGDVEALGFLIQMVKPVFVLSGMLLADILGVIRPLTVWLQSSHSKVDITNLLPA